MIGEIYVIYHIDKIVVVGSTEKTIDERWAKYEKKVKSPKYTDNTHTMMREHGIDNYEIELLEEVEVENKCELYAIEGMWQEMFENLGIKLYNKNRARGEPYGSPEYMARKRERERERYREIGSQRIPCELCGRDVTRKTIRRHQSSDYCNRNR